MRACCGSWPRLAEPEGRIWRRMEIDSRTRGELRGVLNHYLYACWAENPACTSTSGRWCVIGSRMQGRPAWQTAWISSPLCILAACTVRVAVSTGCRTLPPQPDSVGCGPDAGLPRSPKARPGDLLPTAAEAGRDGRPRRPTGDRHSSRSLPAPLPKRPSPRPPGRAGPGSGRTRRKRTIGFRSRRVGRGRRTSRSRRGPATGRTRRSPATRSRKAKSCSGSGVTRRRPRSSRWPPIAGPRAPWRRIPCSCWAKATSSPTVTPTPTRPTRSCSRSTTFSRHVDRAAAREFAIGRYWEQVYKVSPRWAIVPNLHRQDAADCSTPGETP